jgi:cysteine desulfurase family protein (TIGR01976 family)
MSVAVVSAPSIEAIRARFPTLNGDFAYLENAGGSQVPTEVGDVIRDYLRSSYVQLGAGYPQSRQATAIVDEAHEFGALLMNGATIGKTILGPSTTALTHILAGAYSEILKPGDEVIIAETNHEANAGPWARLERFGAQIRIWRVDPATCECSLDSLVALLNDRTKIVALPHVSNLLGHIVDVKRVCDLAHQVGARVVADGVAFAPHRAIDVAALGVDWYVFSMYKVFGPHMAIMFGRHDAFDELTGPNHFFIPRDSIYKFELGGISHEACAGMLAVRPYLAFLGGRENCDRAAIEDAYRLMEDLERPMQERLISYLESKQGVRIIGPGRADSTCVGTISFISNRIASDQVTAHIDKRGIGIRHGHMYAYRLCEALGIPVEPGVVRVSLLHYNTLEEIDRLIAAFDEVL